MIFRAAAPFCVAAALAAAVAGAVPASAFDGSLLRAQDRRGERSLVSPLLPKAQPAPGYRGSSSARDAHRRGEIRSLEEVAASVQQRYPGRLLDARLDQNGPRWTYHLKLLTRDGRVMNVAVDARTAEIIGVGGRR